MVLKRSYSLLAPVYDLFVERPTARWRAQSLQHLTPEKHNHVLIPGIGSGLDLPYLNTGIHYTGFDFNQSMLKKAEHKLRLYPALNLDLLNATIYELPFKPNQFDAIVLHLIIAVVERPEQALAELVRVLRPGGTVLILDKFLRPGQIAPVRRLLNPLVKLIATRFDVVFEKIAATQPDLTIELDQTLKPGNWFRHIILKKKI